MNGIEKLIIGCIIVIGLSRWVSDTPFGAGLSLGEYVFWLSMLVMYCTDLLSSKVFQIRSHLESVTDDLQEVKDSLETIQCEIENKD